MEVGIDALHEGRLARASHAYADNGDGWLLLGGGHDGVSGGVGGTDGGIAVVDQRYPLVMIYPSDKESSSPVSDIGYSFSVSLSMFLSLS